jgi:hypothetical protein
MTEAPPGFNQSLPCGLIDRPGKGQSARALERLDESERAVTERLEGVARREMSEGSEALV